jgi:nucleotide-binding universal stress UspA family protein
LAETILPSVTRLAQGLDAQVTLLQALGQWPETLVGTNHAVFAHDVLERAQASARTYLEALQVRLQQASVRADRMVVVGDAATALVEFAQRERAGLIALATHGYSGMQYWVYGSVAEKVLHLSPVPVLLLRPGQEQESLLEELRQIVVPLDGSAGAEVALPVAVALARSLKLPLALLRVVAVPPPFLQDATIGVRADYAALLDHLTVGAETYLAKVAAQFPGEGVNLGTAVWTGYPAEEIVAFAQQHAGSLVVMAAHGSDGGGNALMGSVARRVLRSALPTLLVPTVAAAAPDLVGEVRGGRV